MVYKLGRFGKYVRQYEKARRTYPSQVFDLFKRLVKVQDPLILDLGCGTGISTRQLAKIGTVIGCDPDRLMLKAARKHKTVNKEKYVTGSAERIPFSNNTFDAVTAFAAFHWFDNKASLNEIKRVLKPGGIFFVVNKTGLKSWGEGYRKAIIKSIRQDIAHFREDVYHPKQSLAKNGFKQVLSKQWKSSELYSKANALEYVQSVSIWNSVPAVLKAKAIQGLKTYFKELEQETGKIERKFITRVVSGKK